MPTSEVAKRKKARYGLDKLQKVRSIRDEALRILRQIGEIITVDGKIPIRVAKAEIGKILMIYNTPFTPLPSPSEEIRYELALARKPMLPYSLDIFYESRKVLSVQWEESDRDFEVISFKDGAWSMLLKSQLDV